MTQPEYPDKPLTKEMFLEAAARLQPDKLYVTKLKVSLRTYHHIIRSNPEKDWGYWLDYSVHILDGTAILCMSDGSVQVGVFE